jgi:hypothetical protein
MRAVVSIILAATLVTVPVTQVLAQADQQAQSIVTTDSTATPEGRIGVPDVEDDNAALLWLAGDVEPAETDSLAYAPPYRRVSTAGWVGIVVGGLVVLFVIAAFALPCYDTGCG